MRTGIVIGILLCALTSFGQVGVQLPAQDFAWPNWSARIGSSSIAQSSIKAPIPTLESMFTTNQNLSTYSYEHLAFFCKIEVDIEKAVKIPVKIRLGSVDYVDYLEGKR